MSAPTRLGLLEEDGRSVSSFEVVLSPPVFRVYLCLCVRAFACALLQLRQRACLSHALTNRSTASHSRPPLRQRVLFESHFCLLPRYLC